MKNFTAKRFEMSERKISKALSLLTEVRNGVDECSVGDYRAKDTEKIRYLRQAALLLDDAIGRADSSVAYLSRAVPPMGRSFTDDC